MLSVIDKAIDTLTENVGFYKQKAADPIELGNRMNRIKAELEDMTLKINRTVEDIAIRYGETGGFIDKKVGEEVVSYRTEIGKINGKSSSSIDELEKISFRKIDMPESVMQNKIIAMWALVHGLSAIATMPNVEYDKDWETRIEENNSILRRMISYENGFTAILPSLLSWCD